MSTNRMKELNENQETAFDELIDKGGDERWVSADEVGHTNTIKALARRKLVQIEEVDGDKYVAIAGLLLESPDDEESNE